MENNRIHISEIKLGEVKVSFDILNVKVNNKHTNIMLVATFFNEKGEQIDRLHYDKSMYDGFSFISDLQDKKAAEKEAMSCIESSLYLIGQNSPFAKYKIKSYVPTSEKYDLREDNQVERFKKILSNLKSENKESYEKAIISEEKKISDMNLLDKVYDKFSNLSNHSLVNNAVSTLVELEKFQLRNHDKPGKTR